MTCVRGKDFGLASLFVLLAAGLPPDCVAQGPGEDPRDILAVRVRSQGYTCNKPIRAERDLKLSGPDVPAWILTCDNGTYRIVLHADMAAQIVKLQ